MTSIALGIASTAAMASDPNGQWANSENHAWYESQRNASGGSCCGSADATWYRGDYHLQADGSVKLDNGKTVDKDKVLTGMNPTGHAVLWISKWGTIYCFSPGALI